MSGLSVRLARAADLEELLRRRTLLYDGPAGGGVDAEEIAETERLIAGPKGAPGTVGNAACFVAEDGAAGLCGFAEVMIRSHAEGCWKYTAGGRLGIACLEGWWVDPERRGTGVGRALVAACEAWARAQESPALASDALLDNIASHAAHRAVGFREVERTVHFVKPL